MSLLTQGPHTVTVFLEEEVLDFEGNYVRRPSETGVVVEGVLMQPVASARGAFGATKVNGGQHVLAAYKLICQEAPVGWWSRVEWVDRDGNLRKFGILGGPLRRDFSEATRHISVTLKEQRGSRG